MARNLHQTPEVSVLVPVMNEQGNIRPLIDEIAAVYNGRAFEIIYVNDASNDGTAADLTAAQKDVQELRVIHHQDRSGQSAAVRTALLASRAPLIAVLDGDGQNIPADLPALEAAFDNLGQGHGLGQLVIGGVAIHLFTHLQICIAPSKLIRRECWRCHGYFLPRLVLANRRLE